jgi:hypothetical protein
MTTTSTPALLQNVSVAAVVIKIIKIALCLYSVSVFVSFSLVVLALEEVCGLLS